jgi:hypothetical protein
MSDSNALKSILLLAANPKGTVSLRLQEEEREIKERLRLAGYGKVPINSSGATVFGFLCLKFFPSSFHPWFRRLCRNSGNEIAILFFVVLSQFFGFFENELILSLYLWAMCFNVRQGSIHLLIRKTEYGTDKLWWILGCHVVHHII